MMENKETKESIIELIAYNVVEKMKHTDGYYYDRNHYLDDTMDGCIEWYPSGCVGLFHELIDDKLSEELEKEYNNIKKQGFKDFENELKQ